jgi:cold-inducible RNA-binding protein
MVLLVAAPGPDEPSHQSALPGVHSMVNIYVGNLPYSATEDDLRSLFSAHGVVDRVSLITDRITGRPRGFAFVEMADQADAEAAIQALNGAELGGRTLTVNIAKPRSDRDRPRGGGRRGGY